MKAREYLEQKKEEIYYFDLVKKSVMELLLLRFDPSKTEEYFNRYLFADMRHRIDKNFVPREGEVDHRIALAVRVEILNVIADDPLFVHAHNIIAESRNSYCQSPMMKLREPKMENPEEVYELQSKIGSVVKLFEPYDYRLNDTQKRRKNVLMQMVEELYMDASPTDESRRTHTVLKKTLVEKNREIAMLQEMVAKLESRLSAANHKTVKAGLTVKEISLVFYYLFDKMGLDFSNSDKTKWARFVGALTGHSPKRMRNIFNFDFDARSTRKNLRAIAPLFSELFPDIERKILNDLDPSR